MFFIEDFFSWNYLVICKFITIMFQHLQMLGNTLKYQDSISRFQIF